MTLTWVRPLLDGINVAAIGLMAAVAVILALDAVVDVMTIILFLAALALLIRYEVNSAVLVGAGVLISLVREFLP